MMIEAEYFRDDAAQSKLPPPDTMPLVDHTSLVVEASTPSPFVKQACSSASSIVPLVCNISLIERTRKS